MNLLRIGNKQDHKVPGRPPRFELIAGSVCLDFVNTLDDRPTKPRELLAHYRDLVRFGEAAGLLKPSQLRRLLKRSSTDPHGAQQALRRAKALTFDALIDVIALALDSISWADTLGWFTLCGFLNLALSFWHTL